MLLWQIEPLSAPLTHRPGPELAAALALSLVLGPACHGLAEGRGSAPPASTESFSGRVVGISDGDTITVLRAGRPEVVRLEGIDCPERGQDFSRRAKEFTSDLVYQRDVKVIGTTRDRYGRLVAQVLVDERDLALELVRAGLAWHFVRYSSDRQLAEAERTARARKVGLWAQGRAVPPWEYRAGRRSQ